jgi:hypothetical protein
MINTVHFTHRNLNITGKSRSEKINSYINSMGGTGRLLEYFLSNLKFTEENISEIKIIEEDAK